MAKYSQNFDATFFALSDPTRRAIISHLCDGPKSVGELSEPFELALPSLLKHVRVLEASGLIRTAKQGRVRTCRIEPRALQEAEDWLHQHLIVWESRLDRMEAHIQRMKRKH